MGTENAPHISITAHCPSRVVAFDVSRLSTGTILLKFGEWPTDVNIFLDDHNVDALHAALGSFLAARDTALQAIPA